nr:transcriptional regulator [Herbaspirillum sp. ASV7]
MPKEIDEKKAFAARLKQALGRSPKKVSSATDLSIQFNLRHPNESITVQAAQKWLSGTARPTPDKIETLAEWLNVSAQWLRYGIAEGRSQDGVEKKKGRRRENPTPVPNAQELELLQKIRALPEHQRFLVTEIIEQFSIDGEMWRD